MSKEAEDLATHVEICAIRYQGIQEQFTVIEDRMDRIETDIREIKASNQRNFDEIKQMLATKMAANQQAIIAASGTIIVALIGFLGYLLTHIR
jgi:septation ring formation regulator EzrA